jgi:hypothetical protein
MPYRSKFRCQTSGVHSLALIAVCLLASAAQADSLNPFVIGGIRDTLPVDGVGNTVTTSPFIYNNTNNGQHRAIVEYDVSALPKGLVLSASLTGRVGPNNSLDTGLREHLVEVYTGNGVVDLADYNVPGIEAGRFSHPSGGSTNYNLNVTGILHNLLAAGADYIGMRISPLSSDMPPDVLSSTSTVPKLNFEILPAGAQTRSILPAYDARVARTGTGPYSMTQSDLTILVQKLSSGTDRRAILEYNLSGIPSDADITDAKIVFDINLFTSGSTTSAQPILYGFAGNGTAQLDDAFLTSTQIGVSPPVQELGLHTVDVDHDYIESLLGTSNFLGVAMVGDNNSHQFGFGASEYNATYVPATLMLTYAAPPNPADFNFDNLVGIADLTRWKGAFAADDRADSDGDGDTDGADFLAWQRHMGSNFAAASNVAVPEPRSVGTVLMLFSLSAGIVGRFRR